MWGTILGTAFATEFLGLYGIGVPLSRVTARAFRTHTATGRFTFGLAWGALSFWFVPHVCKYVVTKKYEPTLRRMTR